MVKLLAAAAAGLLRVARRVATRAMGVSGGSARAESRPRRRGGKVFDRIGWRGIAGTALIVASCVAQRSALPPVDDPSFDEAIVAQQAAAEKRGEATPQKQRLACIWPTSNEQAHVSGKLMPRVVRVIGTYPHQDSYGREQLMVLPAGETNLKNWIPVPKDAVRFVGCGNEFSAFQELEAAHSALPMDH